MRILVLTFLLLNFSLQAQNLQAYQLYNADGEKVSFAEMTASLAEADVVLFGELHNNPICHWLQFEITQSLHQQDSNMVLGAEMFEADNQEPLNLYLQDSIDSKGLDSLARLWNNYKTDYKGLVDFAKGHQLPFIATNIPRPYARQVFKQGLESLDTLSDSVKNWIAPLPIDYDGELPGYKAMLEMMGGHGGENLPKAQAIKDATMAHFIVLNLPEDGIFIHYNGDYHSKDFEGISWYLNQYAEDLKIMTISTQVQDNVNELDSANGGHADFTLLIDGQVTSSY
ncbi:ChaN family lipoprotein [Croceimicrobium hydrocarbonivorans]|uniref:ChaN family lipoprotein n=1 Tax=Croceimicrobium hydrocarbonivorans TaxID=2761580 RepID=A0A7H0VBN6_9FLAO|nr:ChaN family lipoprotein [Croceimicrobium hydrocarbonivorans]QNR23134.1 ChaN family lipoprotein [Croceimicrobium hydrocarbonivorans]